MGNDCGYRDYDYAEFCNFPLIYSDVVCKTLDEVYGKCIFLCVI